MNSCQAQSLRSPTLGAFVFYTDNLSALARVTMCAMIFADATPATTVNTVTTPDGKWTYTVTSTTTTTVTLAVASPDLTTIKSDSGTSIYDSVNTWTVAKGVIQLNGVAMAGTNNVAKLVWSKGVIWQTNGSLWWSWDANNEIWASGTAPV